MAVEIITKEDLELFRIGLLNELKEFLSTSKTPNEKRWMKSADVRKWLHISPGTLQNMRVSGKIRCSKMGGIIYYSFDDLENLLEENIIWPS
jgi:Helix-turn-helix domain